MDTLFVLIPVLLALSIAALLAFLWTLRSAQYDDLDGAVWRILSDDDTAPSDDEDRTPQ
jgi:cbb3-type cytochrome oxidase maturation protein